MTTNKSRTRAKPAMPCHDMQHPEPNERSRPQRQALLLNDDLKGVEYWIALLAGLAYSVRTYTNYQEAEACLDVEPFEVVVVSPAFEGHRLMELALALNHREPAVVLTRCLEINCCVAALQLGMANYPEKDLSPAEFEHLLVAHCLPELDK